MKTVEETNENNRSDKSTNTSCPCKYPEEVGLDSPDSTCDGNFNDKENTNNSSNSSGNFSNTSTQTRVFVISGQEKQDDSHSGTECPEVEVAAESGETTNDNSHVESSDKSADGTRTNMLTKSTASARTYTKVSRKKQSGPVNLKCGICKHKFNEPRLLPCLHSFCTSCLEKVEPFFYGINRKDKNIRPQDQTSQQHKENAGKGNFRCPLCEALVDLPKEGVRGLPLNFVVANMQADDLLTMLDRNLTCDLCTTETIAADYCRDCVMDLCTFCSEAHKRQKRTSDHVVLNLDDARLGQADYLRRTTKCVQHPAEDVQMFCETCDRTICRDCGVTAHREHQFSCIRNVEERQIGVLKNLLSQTTPQIIGIKSALSRVINMAMQVKEKTTSVQNDVNRHINEYIEALEKRRHDLLKNLSEIKDNKQSSLQMQHLQLSHILADIDHCCKVTEDVLEHGSPAEILSVKRTLVRRLREINRSRYPAEPCVDSFVKFSPSPPGREGGAGELAGTILSQFLSAKLSVLQLQGAESGGSLREGSKAELLLVTMDTDGRPYQKGGEKVTALVISKDNIQKTVRVQVHDQGDGTYKLEFVPYEAGQFILYVKLHNQHVQGSPLSLSVRPSWERHTGIWHCCSFCSSGGRKEATCNCGATMLGGYRGCGHGHVGHPGHKHWSCCGCTVENSPCRAKFPAAAPHRPYHYQAPYAKPNIPNTTAAAPPQHNPHISFIKKLPPITRHVTV